MNRLESTGRRIANRFGLGNAVKAAQHAPVRRLIPGVTKVARARPRGPERNPKRVITPFALMPPARRRQQAAPKGAAHLCLRHPGLVVRAGRCRQMVRQDVGPRARLLLRQDLALDLHVVRAGPFRGGNDDFESTDRLVDWQADKKRRNNVCSTSVMTSYRHPKQEARSRMIIGIIRE
jgi:hypothetical protein